MTDIEFFEEDLMGPLSDREGDNYLDDTESDDGSTIHYQMMKPSTLAGLLKRRDEGQEDSDDFIVIDVRDDDCLGGHIPGSVNHPAFAFQAELDKMVERYRRTPKLIFHCRHSQIRGPQCATMFSERLHEICPEDAHKTRIFLLQDGFEGWLCRYGAGNPLLVQDYHASIWRDALDGLSPLKRMLYTQFDPADD